MSIELSKEDRAQAIASIERYFETNFEQRIGNVSAGALLGATPANTVAFLIKDKA